MSSDNLGEILVKRLIYGLDFLTDISKKKIYYAFWKNKEKRFVIEFYINYLEFLDKKNKELFLAKTNLVLLLKKSINKKIISIQELKELSRLNAIGEYITEEELHQEPVKSNLRFEAIRIDVDTSKSNPMEPLESFITYGEYTPTEIEPEYIPPEKWKIMEKDVRVYTGHGIQNLRKLIKEILFEKLSNIDTLLLSSQLSSDFYNKKAKIRSIYFIGKYHLEQYSSQLVEFLNSIDADIRIASIWALGETRNKAAITNLKSLFNNFDSEWNNEKFEILDSLLKLIDQESINEIYLSSNNYKLKKWQKELLQQSILCRGRSYLHKHENIYYKKSMKENKIEVNDKKEKSKIKKTEIFFAFAEEDDEKTYDIYLKLMDLGYDPWMYSKDGLGGEKWKEKIEQKIRESDKVIICFSKQSVVKDGFFQKELKIAIDEYEEKPKDTIYLIPIRLDDCKVPDILVGTIRIYDLTWIDYFKKDGFEKLQKAIDK